MKDYRPRVPIELRQKITHAFATGMSTRMIASRYGVAKTTAHRIATKSMSPKLQSLAKIVSLVPLTPNEREVISRMTTAELVILASLLERMKS